MAQRFDKALKTVTIAVTCAAGLSACGIKGDLKTPPPVFGSERVEPLKPAPIDVPTPPLSQNQSQP